MFSVNISHLHLMIYLYSMQCEEIYGEKEKNENMR